MIHPTPELPATHTWDPRTRGWWAEIWRRPAAAKYLPIDVHGLVMVAKLVEMRWSDPAPELLAEIREQCAQFFIDFDEVGAMSRSELTERLVSIYNEAVAALNASDNHEGGLRFVVESLAVLLDEMEG